ncbi:hypothetical protein GYMLUDRAFT_251405 [Collybiopsis luxurians FD-317 M1]|uniref:Uncharacterized protein n=1 Tax=Collybiopsis luxurians FD-317 M1 TaxID=944289 RepID=A0A0D0CBK3_9AGAR|nr:hypothetical protein GYMLUDRAFT_251405 [Collybiopsis luxurians FD-317 M1]
MVHQAHYLILNSSRPVGRPLAEDKSNHPKPIKLLATSAHQDEIRVSHPSPQYRCLSLTVEVQWVLEGNPHGYIAKIRGDPTAPGPPPKPNDKVFALLLEEEIPEEWILEPVPQHGVNHYIILTHDRQRGWVTPKEEDGQISCRPLIATMSIPPQYESGAVFELRRVE